MPKEARLQGTRRHGEAGEQRPAKEAKCAKPANIPRGPVSHGGQAKDPWTQLPRTARERTKTSAGRERHGREPQPVVGEM